MLELSIDCILELKFNVFPLFILLTYDGLIYEWYQIIYNLHYEWLHPVIYSWTSNGNVLKPKSTKNEKIEKFLMN